MHAAEERKILNKQRTHVRFEPPGLRGSIFAFLLTHCLLIESVLVGWGSCAGSAVFACPRQTRAGSRNYPSCATRLDDTRISQQKNKQKHMPFFELLRDRSASASPHRAASKHHHTRQIDLIGHCTLLADRPQSSSVFTRSSHNAASQTQKSNVANGQNSVCIQLSYYYYNSNTINIHVDRKVLTEFQEAIRSLRPDQLNEPSNRFYAHHNCNLVPLRAPHRL